MSSKILATALVTGAASGMGKAVAEYFIEQGWQMIAVDLAFNQQTSKSLQHNVICDIAKEGELIEEVAGALQDSPPLKAVINAAGIFPTSSLDTYNEALYRRIFDVNVLGSLNVVRACRPYLAQSGGGNIVLFASVDAFAVSNNQLLYCASKAAVVALTRSLAIELAAENIGVNAIAPGWVETEGTLAGGRIQKMIEQIPLRRAAKPDEIAQWVWNLACKPSYITGETLCIAGGSFMR